jgi:hypothetical protein
MDVRSVSFKSGSWNFAKTNRNRSWGVEMAGFNNALGQGRIARQVQGSQSKKLMHGIKGIYSEPSECGTFFLSLERY